MIGVEFYTGDIGGNQYSILLAGFASDGVIPPVTSSTVAFITDGVGGDVYNLLTGGLGISSEIPSGTVTTDQLAAMITLLQNTLSSLLVATPTPAEVASAVINVLNATTIPVDTVKIKGQTISGTGTESDPWGP